MGGKYIADLKVICPDCGTAYDTRSSSSADVNTTDTIPLNIRIELESFAYGYRLTACGMELMPSPDMQMWYKRMFVERIYFDIDKRKTTFKKYVNGKIKSCYELGNPFDYEFRRESNLTYLFGHSPISGYRSQFTRLIQKLRKSIVKSLSKKMGFKVKSMYRSYGKNYGPFIIPILNIAYRMICIDAPNLSNKVLSAVPWGIDDTGAPIYYPDKKFLSLKTLDSIRKSKNTTSAFINLTGLPDKRAFRKIINKEPFDAILLSQIYKNFNKNIDDTVSIYRYCVTPYGNGYYESYPYVNDLLSDAEHINAYYSADDTTKLFKHGNRAYEFNDTASMLSTMSDDLKRKFLAVKPSILAAHDWLAEAQWKENHKMIPFDLSNPLCRRLAMQSGRIKFFLPHTSFDLYDAGKKLKNCVGSYVDRVINNESQIVLVSDDKGKLVICIEVSSNKQNLVQAKLFGNKPVSTDKVLNTTVINWAEKIGVNWRVCPDVAATANNDAERAAAAV